MLLCQLFEKQNATLLERSDPLTFLEVVAEYYLLKYNETALERKSPPSWIMFLAQKTDVTVFPNPSITFQAKNIIEPWLKKGKVYVEFIQYLRFLRLDYVYLPDNTFGGDFNGRNKVIRLNTSHAPPLKRNEVQHFGSSAISDYTFKHFKSIMIHELAHAWQDFRSGGKFDKSKDGNYKIKNADTDFKGYWNTPYEIDARFAAAVNHAKRYVYDSPFRTFWNQIKQEIKGQHSLNSKQYNHFKQKAAKVYHDLRIKASQNGTGEYPAESKVKRAMLDILPDMYKPIHDLIEHNRMNVDDALAHGVELVIKEIVSQLRADEEYVKTIVNDNIEYIKKDFTREFRAEFGMTIDEWNRQNNL